MVMVYSYIFVTQITK